MEIITLTKDRLYLLCDNPRLGCNSQLDSVSNVHHPIRVALSTREAQLLAQTGERLGNLSQLSLSSPDFGSPSVYALASASDF